MECGDLSPLSKAPPGRRTPSMGLIESIRRWIDGETADDVLEEADEHTRPRRVWEEFLVKIAREVEAVMQREMFTPPGGPTYIPREYIVYLSNEDDREWQGDKRRGLEQGLFHVLPSSCASMALSTKANSEYSPSGTKLKRVTQWSPFARLR
jgi:hypothetical protein